jgi:ribosomal protein S18 acetylase RimI-like enzyme
MVPVSPDFFWQRRDSPRHHLPSSPRTSKTGEDHRHGDGVDHGRAFGDPEHGASLWCLAVDPQAAIRASARRWSGGCRTLKRARSSAYLDLSVLHDNEQAIALYEKLGFERCPSSR